MHSCAGSTTALAAFIYRNIKVRMWPDARNVPSQGKWQPNDVLSLYTRDPFTNCRLYIRFQIVTSQDVCARSGHKYASNTECFRKTVFIYFLYTRGGYVYRRETEECPTAWPACYSSWFTRGVCRYKISTVHATVHVHGTVHVYGTR